MNGRNLLHYNSELLTKLIGATQITNEDKFKFRFFFPALFSFVYEAIFRFNIRVGRCSTRNAYYIQLVAAAPTTTAWLKIHIDKFVKFTVKVFKREWKLTESSQLRLVNFDTSSNMLIPRNAECVWCVRVPRGATVSYCCQADGGIFIAVQFWWMDRPAA